MERRPQVQVSAIGDTWPVVEEPFVVLIDANDEDWADDSPRAERLAKQLLDAGCRYCVCFGARSEAVHDRIDDVIVRHEYDGVTTTFHEDEPREDVADFFTTVAIEGMKGALALIRDVWGWRTSFDLHS